MGSTTPSSPVQYFSNIDEAEFQELNKESSEIETSEYQLDRRLQECSSFSEDQFSFNFILLEVALIGKYLDFRMVSSKFIFLGLLILSGLSWAVVCITKYKELLYWERKARSIQLKKQYLCRKAENFVRRSEGVERGDEAATTSEVMLEYRRSIMISIKMMHSNEVKSFYWVFWRNLITTGICLVFWFIGCSMLIDTGLHWFHNHSRSFTAAI